MATKIDKAYDNLVEEFKADKTNADDARDNYAIVAEELGITIESDVAPTKGKEEYSEPVDEDAIEVIRCNKLEGDGHIKAFVDLSYHGLISRGYRVVETDGDLFVGYPARNDNGEWFPITYTKNTTLKDAIQRTVLKAYSS